MLEELTEDYVERLHEMAEAVQTGGQVELSAAVVVASAASAQASLRLQETIERLAQQHARRVALVESWSAERGTDELAIWLRNGTARRSGAA